MIKKIVALLALVSFLVACSSTTMIKSNPSGAKLYIDGIYKCETPCSYKDSAPVGTAKTVVLRKEGFKETRGKIRKEELDIVPLIGGIFFLFPYVWMMKYPSDYTFEMEK